MRLWIVGNPTPLEFDDTALAEAIIRSPTCVYKVELQSPFKDSWADITGHYGQYIKARINYWKGMKRMRKITTTPKFQLGQIIDLSYKHGGMPNRIYIMAVFWREQDNQWQYQVMMESTGETAQMSEQFINDRKSKQNSAVYKNPDIMARIEEGWRFCGNYDTETAKANAKLIAENEGIANVRLYPALSYNNTFMNGQMGIWIKYNHIIHNDGRMGQLGIDEFVDIK